MVQHMSKTSQHRQEWDDLQSLADFIHNVTHIAANGRSQVLRSSNRCDHRG